MDETVTQIEVTEDAPVVEPAPAPADNSPIEIREIGLSAFRGVKPEIPVQESFLRSVRETDPDPLFVTLPIIEIDRVSANKLRYTRAMCAEISEQINRGALVGIRGHVADADRGTAYPPAEIFWLGSVISENKVWAKGYIPPGSTKNEYRIRKLQNGPVATSIYGNMTDVKTQEDGSRTGRVILETIDLVPPQRAALGPIWDWTITSEMAEGATLAADPSAETETPPEPVQENTQVDEATLKAALEAVKPEQLAEMLGPEAANAFVQHQAAKNKQQVVAETLVTVEPQTLAEMSEVKTRLGLAEMQLAKYAEEAFNRAVSEQIVGATPWVLSPSDEQGNALVNNLRETLKFQIVSELSQNKTADAVPAAVTKVLEVNKPLIDGVVTALMGPNAAVNGSDKRQMVVAEIASPEAQEEAKRALGW